MSSKNDETSGIAIAIGIFAAGAIIMGVLIYAIAVFFSLALTVLSIFAWNKPLTLWGNTATPRDARRFVGAGLIGVACAPVIVLFGCALFGFVIEKQYWIHIYLGGYAIGSLGVAYLDLKQEEAEAAARALIVPPTMPPAPPKTIQSHPEDFTFADWSDDEEFRK
ncbi:hypothetical protein [Aestuariivirga sp.]|uniref:hypothetical protein n=1 Tax=Aestuariivirga sp. TaxID=2650926 RepID=UPI003BA8E27F